jgi:DnaJ-class molecular chaperone
MDVDEYAASLKKFHLHTSASLADIKNAYRNVVKTLHPDINPRATKEDTDTFIDLTKTYERILVLHAEREHRAKPSK